jgi:hypothetical protein
VDEGENCLDAEARPAPGSSDSELGRLRPAAASRI